MKKLFVHHLFFRLFSPVFNGIIIYLLILLINNNVGQLQEEFLGEELYVCIGLSYLIQEFSRLLLVFFKNLPMIGSVVISLFLQIIFSLILCVVLVTVAITLYYNYVLGFSPNSEELFIFNSVFSVVTLLYIFLFVSHQYLHKINEEKLMQEQIAKEHLEEDFKQFKREINPDLLFKSFESLLELIDTDITKTDDYIDELASIYRYVLSNKSKQLVAVTEEIETLFHLEKLVNYLPYRTVKIENNLTTSFLVVPSSLLFIVEKIIKTTIASSSLKLTIILTENNDFFEIKYRFNDKITELFTHNSIAEIIRVYAIYSQQIVAIKEENEYRIIQLPKLKITL